MRMTKMLGDADGDIVAQTQIEVLRRIESSNQVSRRVERIVQRRGNRFPLTHWPTLGH